MPLPVQPWAPGTFPTAKSLNLACYTIDGTLAKPNGTAFHARRPLTAEVLDDVVTLPGSSSGKRSMIDQSGTGIYVATQIVDNAGYYGQTSDGTYPFCAYHLVPAITGSAGDGVTPGGVTIISHLLPLSGSGSLTSCGADLLNNGAFASSGSRQAACTGGHDTIPFFLDLADTTGGVWQPAGYVDDGSGNSASTVINTTDSSGETSRFFTIWAGVSAAQQAAYGTPPAPAPYPAYTGATTIGTTLAGGATVNINGANGIKGPLDFLSSPPLLRATLNSSQGIPNNTATQVVLSPAASLDPYSGWAGATPAWTVPRDGLYLAHAAVAYAAKSGGARQAGINAAGVTYWGPAYPGSGSTSVICTKTQILDLAAGDVVQIWTRQSSGGTASLTSGDPSRLILAWLGGRGLPAQKWTPPDPGSSWQAGTGAALPALFQQHAGNDLGFLISRPYLLAYQTTAQAGFANNTANTVVMGAVAGPAHATPGDSYGGWTAGTANAYAAQAPGWYLAVMEAFATYPSTTSTCALTAAFSVPSSGGRAPAARPDIYQQIFPSASTYPPGATAIGLYYLLAGETITPQVQALDYSGSGTWGTTVTGVNSHFELIWVSE